MRICVVAHSHILGGMERHVLTLLTAMSAAGHTMCFAGPRDSWLGEQCMAQGIETFDLAMHGMYDVGSAVRLARFAKRWNADLLHGHSQRGTHYAVWAGSWSGRPAIATAHSTTAYSRFKRATRIICVSDAVRDFLLGLNFAPEKLLRIHSGVPDITTTAPSRSAARAMLGLKESQLVLGMVARFVKDKGHEVAIDALPHIKHPDTVILLAGDDNNACANELRRHIASRGLTDQVRFLGQRADVDTIYAACDQMLAPSYREALSLSLIEAAAMSLPLIASRVGGIPEVVEDGLNGLLIPPGDSRALADAINSLQENPERRSQMAIAARERFLKLFSLEQMCKSVDAAYREVLEIARTSSGPSRPPFAHELPKTGG